MGSTAYDSSSSALSDSPAAHGQGNAAAAAALVSCAGVAFTVTEGNEVAEVVGGGAARVLGSESFLDAGTGLRRHFVDVQGGNEAMLFFVSVNEDQRRIVDIRRFS
ncbi:unnamed protein product [Urochloa decumbens]|uniref:Uncharacterized protein n=1 Tax=Urochloa decumbens TaxID=240449 RepID=A0ABC9C6Q7_9POAL